ncbi:bifunctional phosphopantothenoylcysteine decarboxylase/phosphopantothenate synthase [Arthrobacter sp. H14]|uniref:bifunctional phosphopantothenoylcysteine decarboxylase/phosphopantothenate synthase n=1 Tax=Arthrobacter sp. H14 TaxID=1312959 RepID=UPI00047BAD78|nr:bifunctional phosphopantothenoylcysteine decarboxylase/phosphopantothenate synthase [Arthrobacter sp. H14]
MRIILGVGGGIAAYKSATLLRLFTEAGHSVTVIPTASAGEFVGRATWEALSGQKVPEGIFDDVEKVNHVRLGQEADLIVVAPATADLLARAAAGMANDLLTNTLLMAACPVLMAPAMHTEMWRHPATSANVKLLRERGITVLEPATGRLTGVDSGPGRLPEPDEIYAAAMNTAGGASDGAAVTQPDARQTAAFQSPVAHSAAVQPAAGPLAGRTFVITAGGTREPLDPVRYLGNRSSGKQGAALAKAALDAGATVHFIAAHTEVEPPAGVELTAVETALELREAAQAAAQAADVVVMAAAVADFRPAELSGSKIKKRDDGEDPVITLVRNPDILQELVQNRDATGSTGVPLIVGFAAETGDAESDILSYARRKLERKGCDLLVLNQVGTGVVFGQDETSVQILSPGTEDTEAASGTKADVAVAIIDRIAVELKAQH